MGTTQPIRKEDELYSFRMYYADEKPNVRNYTLIVLGLNTALRIGDLLSLKWSSVYNFQFQSFYDHILIHEQKTGKRNNVLLNATAKDALQAYFNERSPEEGEYIFTKTTCHEKPLNRSQAYRIVKTAAVHTTQEDCISCHSLRKTFGYHAWKQGTPPALLMDIYNHSSYRITHSRINDTAKRGCIHDHIVLCKAFRLFDLLEILLRIRETLTHIAPEFFHFK